MEIYRATDKKISELKEGDIFFYWGEWNRYEDYHPSWYSNSLVVNDCVPVKIKHLSEDELKINIGKPVPYDVREKKILTDEEFSLLFIRSKQYKEFMNLLDLFTTRDKLLGQVKAHPVDSHLSAEDKLKVEEAYNIDCEWGKCLEIFYDFYKENLIGSLPSTDALLKELEK